jgi:hypothetical protein
MANVMNVKPMMMMQERREFAAGLGGRSSVEIQRAARTERAAVQYAGVEGKRTVDSAYPWAVADTCLLKARYVRNASIPATPWYSDATAP